MKRNRPVSHDDAIQLADSLQTGRSRSDLVDVVKLSLKLGMTAFGGPAAHVAMLRQEVVERRRWISEQHFLDLLGVTNLIPGPNSTEMVIHIGYERARWRGLILGGACFILPAVLITLVMAWLYVRYGSTPTGDWLLYGVKPVIIAIVAQALWNLGRAAVNGVDAVVVGISIFALYLLGVSELLLLFGGGLALLAVRECLALLRRGGGATLSMGWPIVLAAALTAVTAGASVPYSGLRLFFTFLKIGSVLYGSGYVLLAFLRNDFVVRYGWLTEQQLLDAVAVGQFTPGPVFTTATFVGYIVGGVPGAILATVGIFCPAFVFVRLVHPLVQRLRASPFLSRALDGINLAAIGLMAAVTWTLGREAIVDLTTVILALFAGAALIYWKVNSAWLVLGGGGAGLLVSFVR